MVLIDSTIWIDFFHDISKSHVMILEEYIKNDEDICICGVILTEVLQGIRHDTDYLRSKDYFDALTFLPMTKATFLKSSELYRSLRIKGVTIRKPVDCMIASVAIEHDLPLLHNDRDFSLIARHSRLRVVETD